MKPVDVVNETVKRLDAARAKVDRKRLGMRIYDCADLKQAASMRFAVASPTRGSIYPAAWVLNMNYSCVCAMIESGLFIYTPKGGSK